MAGDVYASLEISILGITFSAAKAVTLTESNITTDNRVHNTFFIRELLSFGINAHWEHENQQITAIESAQPNHRLYRLCAHPADFKSEPP